jgi:hypothetical protein
VRLLSLLQPPGQVFRLTENLFLRLLGLVYLIAFASLYPQIVGLVGANGISPAAGTLAAMHSDYGWRAYLDVPSLFWFFRSDTALQIICLLGCVAALLLMLGLAIRIAAVAAYVLYLSLITIGQPFTGFQWDSLLLETGFLAIFAGATWLPFAYRLLLFRLIFESGLVKLTSGDGNWRNLHALRYHFFTQPLPTPLAYYMQQMPGWLLDTMTFATLFIELLVPFFLFAHPRRIRQITAAVLVFLQLFIALTGNYGFFNLLTIILCVWALDDDCFPGRRAEDSRQPRFPRSLNIAVACVILLSILQVFGLQPALLEPLEIVNPYGLFAVMTTSRIELVIEGSEDNLNWRPYLFRYKPGPPQGHLPLVAPYQPRLDWQMWFAALGSPQNSFWTKTLVFRFLTGEPTVLGLLKAAPFAKPPRQIRILAYSYTFAEPSERKRNGAIWDRKLLGIWFGPVSIDSVGPKQF